MKVKLKRAHRAPSAFTLIELLVVVAIIAILAALAVPNFLESQTRAKVARVKADLRTLATSIESYTVDNQKPPYDGEPGFTYGGWVNALKRLTTPVAYQTSLLVDVFQDRTITEPTIPGQTHYIDYPTSNQHTYDYSTAYWNDVPNDPLMTPLWQKNFGNARWKTTSAGPDLRHINAGSNFGMAELYDPTNGTNSMGDIIRIQGQ
ncbi:MAG: prepilin-type N-terminal cleavage/methylation domain-containing protein [Candidatus Sumerlaeaceae bacterium]|nr:prepilin-type N-terminal cleavage/methylation domain-containing protein [Candidatus Sumerlaeaceae bacterium]